MAESEAPYRFDEADGYCAITLLPELNQAPWGDINNIGTSLLQSMHTYMDAHKRSPAFLVDLSNLHYIGSAMVALVVRLWKAAKEKDGKMAVVNNDENVLEVLRLSGLDGVWTITETREAGLKSLGISARKAAPQPAATNAGPQLVSATSAPAKPDGAAGPFAIVSLVLVVIALIGLFLFSSDPPPIADQRVGMAMLFGGCVLALVAGSVAASRGIGLPKTLGATNVIGAMALLVAGVACHPKRDAVLLKPDKKPQPVENEPAPSNGKTANTKSPDGKSPEKSKTPDDKTPAKTEQKTGVTTPKKNPISDAPKTKTTKKDGGDSVTIVPPDKKTGKTTPPASAVKPK